MKILLFLAAISALFVSGCNITQNFSHDGISSCTVCGFGHTQRGFEMQRKAAQSLYTENFTYEEWVNYTHSMEGRAHKGNPVSFSLHVWREMKRMEHYGVPGKLPRKENVLFERGHCYLCR